MNFKSGEIYVELSGDFDIFWSEFHIYEILECSETRVDYNQDTFRSSWENDSGITHTRRNELWEFADASWLDRWEKYDKSIAETLTEHAMRCME